MNCEIRQEEIKRFQLRNSQVISLTRSMYHTLTSLGLLDDFQIQQSFKIFIKFLRKRNTELGNILYTQAEEMQYQEKKKYCETIKLKQKQKTQMKRQDNIDINSIEDEQLVTKKTQLSHDQQFNIQSLELVQQIDIIGKNEDEPKQILNKQQINSKAPQPQIKQQQQYLKQSQQQQPSQQKLQPQSKKIENTMTLTPTTQQSSKKPLSAEQLRNKIGQMLAQVKTQTHSHSSNESEAKPEVNEKYLLHQSNQYQQEQIKLIQQSQFNSQIAEEKMEIIKFHKQCGLITEKINKLLQHLPNNSKYCERLNKITIEVQKLKNQCNMKVKWSENDMLIIHFAVVDVTDFTLLGSDYFLQNQEKIYTIMSKNNQVARHKSLLNIKINCFYQIQIGPFQKPLLKVIIYQLFIKNQIQNQIHKCKQITIWMVNSYIEFLQKMKKQFKKQYVSIKRFWKNRIAVRQYNQVIQALRC